MKKLIKGIALLLVLFTLLWIISPFEKNGNEYQLEAVISIEQKVDSVYEYLGNSDNAQRWSVFVSHIEPLNAVSDGATGSLRRCFENEDETGIVWDEEIVENEKNTLRTLTIFNMKNFPLETTNLYTKQLYKSTASNTTSLTLGLYKKAAETTIWDLCKMKMTGYYIAYVFNKNLKGIKREIEQ